MALGDSIVIGGLLFHSEQSRTTMEAFAQGMSALGDVPFMADLRSGVPDCVDFVATWGDRPWRSAATDKPRLYLEAGYINGTGPDYVQNRLRFVSAEWNGLGAHGDDVGDCPDDRWDALNITCSPWNPPGPKLLVLEQHPSDGAANPGALSGVLKDITGFTVKRRPHPLVEPSCKLDADLRWADCAITWGSTAAVEAIIAGVPTVVMSDRCIASEIMPNSLDGLRDVGGVSRSNWLHRLAYRQWTHAEMASGAAWRHLRERCRVRPD